MAIEKSSLVEKQFNSNLAYECQTVPDSSDIALEEIVTITVDNEGICDSQVVNIEKKS